MDIVYDSNLESLPLLCKGKVRDIYQLDERHIVLVATDRLSAFDVVFADAVPDKGRVLTSLSTFWFNKTANLITNHTTNQVATQAVPELQTKPLVAERSMVVRKVKPLPYEAIVRGYLYGSVWLEYQAHSCICGVRLPAGLAVGERLPQPVFTPSTKAAGGAHDLNVDFDWTITMVGQETAQRVRAAALALYSFCSGYAYQRGIIIADTKFEFGLDEQGAVVLIDEVLTPDSSRFWDLSQYQPGNPPVSFDKQFVRDYLEQLGWDKKPPPPDLPQEIIAKTCEKYRQIEQRLIDSRG